MDAAAYSTWLFGIHCIALAMHNMSDSREFINYRRWIWSVIHSIYQKHRSSYVCSHEITVFSKVISNQLAGIFVAATTVFTGATLGAISAFALARFELRSQVESYRNKWKTFDVVEAVIESYGLRVILLIRLCPLVPFNIFNYFIGLTSVSFISYCIGCIGMIPVIFLYCFIGSTLSELTENRFFMLSIIGTIIALIAMLCIGYIAKRRFDKMSRVYYDNKESYWTLPGLEDRGGEEESVEFSELFQDPQYE